MNMLLLNNYIKDFCDATSKKPNLGYLVVVANDNKTKIKYDAPNIIKTKIIYL